MNQLKRILGLVWLVLGPVLFFILIKSAAHNIDANGKGDINKPQPWRRTLVLYLFGKQGVANGGGEQ